MCWLVLSIKIDPAGYNDVINHVQKTSELEKEIWCHPNGVGGAGEYSKYRSPFSGASIGFLQLKNGEKKKKRLGEVFFFFFIENDTFFSIFPQFTSSSQAPQMIYVSKKILLTTSHFLHCWFHICCKCWLGSSCPILLIFFQQFTHHLILVGTSHLYMWCPASLVTPDGPVNLSLDSTLESSGKALGKKKKKSSFPGCPLDQLHPNP